MKCEDNMKKILTTIFSVTLLSLFCLIAACGLGADYAGTYELKSFTAQDGTVYSVGDEYNGEALQSSDVKLTLEEFGNIVVGNQNQTIKKYTLTSNVGNSSLGFWSKDGGRIKMPGYLEGDVEYTAKLSGKTLTVTCPSGDTVKTYVLTKTSD